MNEPNTKLLEFTAGLLLHVLTASATIGVMFCAFSFGQWNLNPGGWSEMTRGMFVIWAFFALLISNGVILEAAEVRTKFITALGGE